MNNSNRGKWIIFFVSVLLVLLFGFWLNYLKIINFNELFSSLQGTKTPEFTISRGDTRLSLSENGKLDALAQGLIDEVLQPAYRTEVLLKERDVIVAGEKLPLPSYYDTWSVRTVSATISAQFDFDKRVPLNIDLSMLIPRINEPISPSSISQTLSNYVIIPPDALWTCEESPVVIQCHTMNATRIDESKLGVSFRKIIDPPEDVMADVVSICQMFIGSNKYDWTTCLHE